MHGESYVDSFQSFSVTVGRTECLVLSPLSPSSESFRVISFDVSVRSVEFGQITEGKENECIFKDKKEGDPIPAQRFEGDSKCGLVSFRSVQFSAIWFFYLHRGDSKCGSISLCSIQLGLVQRD